MAHFPAGAWRRARARSRLADLAVFVGAAVILWLVVRVGGRAPWTVAGAPSAVSTDGTGAATTLVEPATSTSTSHPLPNATVGGLAGLVEIVRGKGGRVDIPDIAADLSIDAKDLLPLVDAAALLDNDARVAVGNVPRAIVLHQRMLILKRITRVVGHEIRRTARPRA